MPLLKGGKKKIFEEKNTRFEKFIITKFNA